MTAADATVDGTGPSRDASAARTVRDGAGRSDPGSPRLFDAGQLIASRYRVIDLIARGGMGEVHEVEDLELGVRLAVKTIRAERLHQGDGVERLKREMLAARRVSHANVVRLHDVGFHVLADQREVAFITMDLLRGETLYAFLRRRGPLPTAEAAPLVAQLAAALDAAHAADVVHRDFKSQNVILLAGRDGLPRAVVTDFGLAEPGADLDGHSTATVEFIGTPAYMAPEQISRRTAITRAADIYALGVVMFEMVTGRLPWTGPTALATAVRRLDEPPPSPRQHVPELPDPWEWTIRRCLERDPAARFASAGAVIAALDGAAARPRRGRARARIAVAALGGIVIAGVAVAASARLRPATTPAAEARSAAAVPSPAAVRLQIAAEIDIARARVDEHLGLAARREAALRGIDAARSAGDRRLEARGLIALGRLESDAGDLDAAADAFAGATTLDASSPPVLVEAWTGLGIVLERQGRIDDARRVLAGAEEALLATPVYAFHANDVTEALAALPAPTADAARGPVVDLARGKVATRSTEVDANPWWQVDLGEPGWIDELAITPGSAAPVDVVVIVSAMPFTAPDLASALAQPDAVRVYHRAHGAASPYRVPIQAAGRYVKLQVIGRGTLSLAEIEVRGLRDLALGKRAVQSTTWQGAVATRAVDGNADGDFYNRSLTHTDGDQPAWWLLDLGPGVSYIDRIIVYNRSDCCAERLTRFHGYVSDQPLPRGATGEVMPDASTWSQRYALPAGPRRVTMTVRRRGGRYVLIELDRPYPLSLAEVMVFGQAR